MVKLSTYNRRIPGDATCSAVIAQAMLECQSSIESCWDTVAFTIQGGHMFIYATSSQLSNVAAWYPGVRMQPDVTYVPTMRITEHYAREAARSACHLLARRAP